MPTELYITWKVNFNELHFPKVKRKMATYEAFLGVILSPHPKKRKRFRGLTFHIMQYTGNTYGICKGYKSEGGPLQIIRGGYLSLFTF